MAGHAAGNTLRYFPAASFDLSTRLDNAGDQGCHRRERWMEFTNC